MKSESKPRSNDVTRCDDYSVVEYSKRVKKFDSPRYLGLNSLELTKLQM